MLEAEKQAQLKIGQQDFSSAKDKSYVDPKILQAMEQSSKFSNKIL